MENNTDYKSMKVTGGEYLTVNEMSSFLGESTNTLKKRLFRLGIKPLSRDALYPISVLETLKNTPPKGRPKKTDKPPATPTKKSKKKDR